MGGCASSPKEADGSNTVAPPAEPEVAPVAVEEGGAPIDEVKSEEPSVDISEPAAAGEAKEEEESKKEDGEGKEIAVAGDDKIKQTLVAAEEHPLQ
ncbi:hypothetical protein Cni_G07670 [Canna indica]|uniref:Uncharacterized protein n=1 Tax=Canna indica TaxID=4628 RepID=A0AAQ3JZ52_9LILI|nr:hypothetical protein Cni_G07670 [Canna indica]